jgi:hypothetical protein
VEELRCGTRRNSGVWPSVAYGNTGVWPDGTRGNIYSTVCMFSPTEQEEAQFCGVNIKEKPCAKTEKIVK